MTPAYVMDDVVLMVCSPFVEVASIPGNKAVFDVAVATNMHLASSKDPDDAGISQHPRVSDGLVSSPDNKL